MIKHAKQILQIARDTELFKKVTMRPFRESKVYPAFYVYKVTGANMDAQTTDNTTYNGPWEISAQIMAKMDTALDDIDLTDYEACEALSRQVLAPIIATGKYELKDIDFFTARIASKDLVICDLIIWKYANEVFE